MAANVVEACGQAPHLSQPATPQFNPDNPVLFQASRRRAQQAPRPRLETRQQRVVVAITVAAVKNARLNEGMRSRRLAPAAPTCFALDPIGVCHVSSACIPYCRQCCSSRGKRGVSVPFNHRLPGLAGWPAAPHTLVPRYRRCRYTTPTVAHIDRDRRSHVMGPCQQSVLSSCAT